MLDVTGFNEYNIKLDGVIGNDAGHTKIGGGYRENCPGCGKAFSRAKGHRM